jgi:hypothetical protein
MEKEKTNLYCTKCERHYKQDDKVVLDAWNSILHESCYRKLTNSPIIDRGTYKEIINKYDFFKELR